MFGTTKLKQEDDDETKRFLSASSGQRQQQQQQQQKEQQCKLHLSPSSSRLRRTGSGTGPSSLPVFSSSAMGTEIPTGGGGETTSPPSASASATLPPPRFFCCFGQLFLDMLPDRVSRKLCPAQRRRLRNLVSVICCLALFAMIHNTMESTMRSIPNMMIAGAAAGFGSTTLVKIKDKNNMNNVDNNAADGVSSDPQPTDAQAEEEQRLNGKGTTDTDTSTGPISSKPKEPQLLFPAYPHVDPPTFDSRYNSSQHFVERWCDLDNNNKLDWFPQGDKLWQRRAPAFIIPGAKFAGTDLLVQYLQGPQYSNVILPPTFHHELSFFFDARFQKYVSPVQQKTRVRPARERLYAKFFNVPALQQGRHLISFDASSGYLFYSTLLPRRIFCVMPWIRLVIVLRNPTDRLHHHYRSAQRKGLRLSFEEWIDKDFRLLHDVGFFQLQNTTSTTTSSSSSSSIAWSESIPINNMTLKDIAWFQYQQQSLEGAVGRSLYEVQLRQWFQALRAIGRKPSKSVLIVWTHDLIQNPQAELTRIAQFLQLPPPLAKNSSSSSSSILKTSTSSSAAAAAALIADINATTATGMNSKTRRRLDDFFRPYNMKLKNVLEAFGIPNSGGVTGF